jgi:VanZ family protein
MNYFFAVLPAAYIFGIFFYADSTIVSQFAVFNPFSLLHIPLYGILTLLLILALCPQSAANRQLRYTLAASIAIAVAIVDEFYQSFIPGRESSLIDVFLDALGVSLALFLSLRGPFSHWATRFQKITKCS